eukprot:6176479-Pleurochrysis_carterae.AAC.2
MARASITHVSIDVRPSVHALHVHASFVYAPALHAHILRLHTLHVHAPYDDIMRILHSYMQCRTSTFRTCTHACVFASRIERGCSDLAWEFLQVFSKLFVLSCSQVGAWIPEYRECVQKPVLIIISSPATFKYAFELCRKQNSPNVSPKVVNG